MGTAEIEIIKNEKENLKLRALIDNGSQVNLISEQAINKLNLKPKSGNTKFIGIGGNQLGQAAGEISLKIRVPTAQKYIEDNFYVMKSITNYQPTWQCKKWSEIQENLADKNYHRPGKIDMLLGVSFWIQIVDANVERSQDGLAVAQATKLGYVIFQVEENPYTLVKPYIGTIVEQIPTQEDEKISIQELSNLLEKFWQVENVPTKTLMTKEEKECEKIFLYEHQRNNEGRYIVKIPFNEKLNLLGKSKNVAIRQFFSMENKMKKNSVFATEYKKFMHEYESLGHMEQINEKFEEGYYTPHHGVQSSKKFRVVFNASAKTTSGVTLNDTQKTGAKLQKDLFFILMSFRKFKYGLTGDIEKMYRQILIHPDHQKYQKIIWRSNEKEQLKVFQLKTVTYGHTAAPHCAIRSLLQCANDHKHEFPNGARIVNSSFYVDDLITGADTESEINEIKNELTILLKKGAFPITKWRGNGELGEELEFKEPEETQSVLGLCWNLEADKFFFRVKIENEFENWTKRKILSQMGRLYDPTGFLSPIIVKGKMIIQNLWKEKIDWDEDLPQKIVEEWEIFHKQMQDINGISINRWYGSNSSSEIQLHGFSDASERGYGAVVYSRVKDENGKFRTELIASKSKVAPLKTVTIPRLELCGANLLMELIKIIQPIFENKQLKIFNWSDSNIVLCWLKKSPVNLKTFVANRVANIQEISEETKSEWRWIAGKENPADLVSRGVNAEDLVNNNLWWHGPEWLLNNECDWPSNSNNEIVESKINEEVNTEMRVIHLIQHEPELIKGGWFKFKNKNQKSFNLMESFSNWDKLVHVSAWILRAKNNFLNYKDKNINKTISTEERENAFFWIIQQDQKFTFSDEIKTLQAKRGSLLRNLTFIWDGKNGILRLGGRVTSENLTLDEQNPIILSKKGKIAKNLVRHAHYETKHGGNQIMNQYLRRKFWIPGVKHLIKSVIKKCPMCFKLKINLQTQLMAELPQSRTTPARPFLRIGVDYAGPVELRSKLGRFPKIVKAYICVFVCLVTRAVHLELVSDATTAAFIAAFRRFVARRGMVAEIISDNGTNFVGANNFLTKISNLNRDSSNQIEREFKAKWKFITPLAPHHGGIYEAAVKSAKHHLIRVIGTQTLTFEEYGTILSQVEAILNSRPMGPLTDEPTDTSALTPGHFIIGEPFIGLPDERDFTELKTNNLGRWEHLQQMIQNFWKRWHREYIGSLVNRSKWSKRNRNLEIGDLVIVKQDNIPPLRWKMARIISVIPGRDGAVRTVKIKTGTGEYLRPITKLGLFLSIEEQENNEN